MSYKYSKEQLKNALAAVKGGKTFYHASKEFNVPKTTLIRKYKEDFSCQKHKGAPSILGTQQEKYLSLWIEEMCERGFPITKNMLIDSVQLLVKELGVKNNFANGRPGNLNFLYNYFPKL